MAGRFRSISGNYVLKFIYDDSRIFSGNSRAVKAKTYRCKIQGPTRCFHSNGKFVCYFCSKFCPNYKKKYVFQNIVFRYAPVFSNISETTGATVPIFELLQL